MSPPHALAVSNCSEHYWLSYGKFKFQKSDFLSHKWHFYHFFGKKLDFSRGPGIQDFCRGKWISKKIFCFNTVYSVPSPCPRNFKLFGLLLAEIWEIQISKVKFFVPQTTILSHFLSNLVKFGIFHTEMFFVFFQTSVGITRW